MNATEFNKLSKLQDKIDAIEKLGKEDVENLIGLQEIAIYENWRCCIEATKSKLSSCPSDLKDKVLNIDNMHSQSDWSYRKYIHDKTIKQKHMFRWDIFMCDLGHNIGSEKNKKRPVLIIQDTRDYLMASTILVAPITTTLTKRFKHEVVLPKHQTKNGTYGIIDLSQIRVVNKSRMDNSYADRLVVKEEYGKYCKNNGVEFNENDMVSKKVEKVIKRLFCIDI